MTSRPPDDDKLITFGQRRRDQIVAVAVVLLAAVGCSAMFLCAVAYWRLFLAP